MCLQFLAEGLLRLLTTSTVCVNRMDVIYESFFKNLFLLIKTNRRKCRHLRKTVFN